jgi:hypothetical protein
VKGSHCVVEASVPVAWAEWSLRVRDREGGQPVLELGATESGTAFHRLVVDVPAQGEQAVPLAPPDASFVCLAVSARAEGFTARLDDGAWFSLERPLLLSGDLLPALGRPAPEVIRVRNGAEAEASVDIVLIRRTA